MTRTLPLLLLSLSLTACISLGGGMNPADSPSHTIDDGHNPYPLNAEEKARFDQANRLSARGESAQALALYQPLAEKGSMPAMYNTGVMLRRLNRQGEAIKWLEKAADLGDGQAHCVLGGIQADILSYAAARRHYEQAAAKGWPCGQNGLASLYMDGSGVKRDFRRSFAFAQKSAAQDDAHGQYLLGLHYLNSWSVPNNPAQARLWIEKAAAQGHEQAQAMLHQ